MDLEMNIIKSSCDVSRSHQRASPTRSLIAFAAFALVLASALVSTSAPSVSEAQFEAKLKTAVGITADSSLSEVQKFFPASFR